MKPKRKLHLEVIKILSKLYSAKVPVERALPGSVSNQRYVSVPEFPAQFPQHSRFTLSSHIVGNLARVSSLFHCLKLFIEIGIKEFFKSIQTAGILNRFPEGSSCYPVCSTLVIIWLACLSTACAEVDCRDRGHLTPIIFHADRMSRTGVDFNRTEGLPNQAVISFHI